MIVSKNTIFLQVFKVFCICFQKPYFLVLAFPFLGFEFLCFFLFFLLLWLDKSGCYVLVSVFVVLGFLVFLWYVFFFCLFLVCFVFFMEGLGVR